MAYKTLLEAAKTNNGTDHERAVIELYAGSSDILANLPIRRIQGNAFAYNRQGNLPGVGWRGVNEAYTPTVGALNPITENLAIAGGEIVVDKFIVDTSGVGQRANEEAAMIQSMALNWTKTFLNGDVSTDPRTMQGLKNRVTGNQLISAGSTANGAALSLAKLDQAIDQCLNPTHIIMNKTMKRRLSAAARLYTVGGYVTTVLDGFGRRVMAYNDLPILTVDLDGDGAELMGFTEPSVSGTDTSTSIYIVSMGGLGLVGLENGGISVRDLGEMQTRPAYLTRIEWYVGMAVFNGRAVVRLNNIGDLAIVA